MNTEDILEKWLSPHFLRSLLLDPANSKQTCVQIARFCAAYYLDYLLFLPSNGQQLPSLYIWGCMEKKEDLPSNSIPLERTSVSKLLSPEYSPALPALLLVKCDHLIEAINYVDHFDDKRSSLILRLLADSVHEKDLSVEYVKAMIVEGVPMEIDRILNGQQVAWKKFAAQISQSIMELDVCLQRDVLIFFEENLLHTAEFLFSQLPLQSSSSNIKKYNYRNPVYSIPEETTNEEEEAENLIFAKIHYNIQILLTSLSKSNRITEQLNFTLKTVSLNGPNGTPNKIPSTTQKYTMHRLLLLTLRIKARANLSAALKGSHENQTESNVPSIAERYKLLLNEDDGECVVLKRWVESATEKEMEEVEAFFNYVQENFKQTSSIPPLSASTREIWLRRIVLNNSTDHRDIRQERVIDWFRTICHPKHRVCDFVISQMLLINSQWTSPGFSFITPGCHALRLSIHPHDLCLGTNTVSANYSLSARDILYTPINGIASFINGDRSSTSSEDSFQDRIFTPRDYGLSMREKGEDLISRYARKHQELMAKTSRPYMPIDERIRAFSRQQGELQKELEREREFLSRSSHRQDLKYYHHGHNQREKERSISSSSTIHTKPSNSENGAGAASNNQLLARQIAILTEKLDTVVQTISETRAHQPQKSIYINDDDEESVISELPFFYDDAPVAKISPVIEKLDFDQLTSRQEDKKLSGASLEFMESLNPSSHVGTGALELETAKTFDMTTAENPMFQGKHFSKKKDEGIPQEWMKLLPPLCPESRLNREAISVRSPNYADNLLIFDGKMPAVQPRVVVAERKAATERGVQTTDFLEIRSLETDMKSEVSESARKVIGDANVKKMSREDIDMILNRVK